MINKLKSRSIKNYYFIINFIIFLIATKISQINLNTFRDKVKCISMLLLVGFGKINIALLKGA